MLKRPAHFCAVRACGEFSEQYAREFPDQYARARARKLRAGLTGENASERTYTTKRPTEGFPAVTTRAHARAREGAGIMRRHKGARVANFATIYARARVESDFGTNLRAGAQASAEFPR